MQPIVIVGAGGHAREQLDLVGAMNARQPRWRVEGFLVDPGFAPEPAQLRGLPVFTGLDWLAERAGAVLAVCAIGAPESRHRWVTSARERGIRFATLVHPSVDLNESIELGEGVILAAGCLLTSDVRIGDHVHVNVGSSISHDCELEDFATLGPGVRLAGAVRVGEGAQLGIGAVVRDRVRVGRWSITGAGAVVVKEVPADCTAVGIPAEPVERRPAGWHLAPEE